MLSTRTFARAAVALLATIASALLSTAAHAEGPAPKGDAEAYCAYVDATAGSQEALLISPQVFASYGIVNGNDATTGDGAVSLPPTQRLTVGLRYSVTGLVQGIATRDRATVECERYAVESDLHRFVQVNREIATAAAVRAQLGVLQGALAKGHDLVQRARTSVERGQGTLQDLSALEGRYDDLSQKVATAEELLAGLPERAAVAAPATLLQRRDAAERKMESAEGTLRRLSAFDLSVRGGYDRFFGTRDNLPLFAVVSLTFTPGALAQPGYESRARDARVAWLHAEEEGIAQRVERLTSRLQAVKASETRRLAEVSEMLTEVQARLHAAEGSESERARRYRELLWFDQIRLEADKQYLRVHLDDLRAALGEGRT